MKFFTCSVAVAVLVTVSPAQFLRSGAKAQIVNGLGNQYERRESSWVSATAGDVVSRVASVENPAGKATSGFHSSFGVLKGKAFASVNALGPASSQSSGSYESFNNFVGAALYDTITLVGAGLMELRLNYALHANNVDPGAETDVFAGLKLDVYNTASGSLRPGAIIIDGPGNRTVTRTLSVFANAGTTITVSLELAAFASVLLSSGVPGTLTASTDAMNTGSLTIEAVSGSFTSASGASYAPVPEPASLAALSLGALALCRRRGARRTR